VPNIAAVGQAPPARRLPMALATWALISLVLLLVLVLLVVKVTRGSTTIAPLPVSAAPAGVVQAATSVSPAVFAEVGAPGPPVLEPPVVLSGQPPLVIDGKTGVVYVGTEFCPYCAAERWALVVALGRFGKFSDLGATSSSSSEVFGGTKTFSFDGAKFQSSDLAFSSVEEYGSSPSVTAPAGYTLLHLPDAVQRQVLRHYDVSAVVSDPGSLPFVDVGNRMIAAGSGIGFSPGLLQGLSMDQIAADLNSPSTPVSQAIVGAANEITAAVCASGGGEPKSICNSPGTLAGAARLGLP